MKTIEEKAKAYDKALEIAKEFYILCKKCGAKDTIDFLEDNSPELKESENEKVKNKLIEFFKGYSPDEKWWGNITQEDILAWLEKQGQEPRKVSIWKHWKNGIAGNGEGKLIYLIKNGDDYSLSSILGFECDYIELSELDNLMLKQGEQKPTDEDMKEALRTEYEKGRADAFAQMQKEWSEEDECTLNGILDDYKSMCKTYRNWLESIKNRIQPQQKQEWSEEDENGLGDAIWCCKQAASIAKDENDMGNVWYAEHWLKSLKERYTWKPSDEQMRALEYIINNAHNTSYSCKIAKELLEQLRKLKGEEV